jgi:hypothetical protein
LGKCDIGNRTVTRIEQEGIKDRGDEKMAFLVILKVLDKKIEPRHPEKHDQRIGSTILGKADVIEHNG